jgi:uncharacterized membrane protein
VAQLRRVAISFMVVGTVWANHLLAFSHLARSDHVLASLNLLELMTVAFLPLPTAVLGTWIGSHPASAWAIRLTGRIRTSRDALVRSAGARC